MQCSVGRHNSGLALVEFVVYPRLGGPCLERLWCKLYRPLYQWRGFIVAMLRQKRLGLVKQVLSPIPRFHMHSDRCLAWQGESKRMQCAADRLLGRKGSRAARLNTPEFLQKQPERILVKGSGNDWQDDPRRVAAQPRVGPSALVMDPGRFKRRRGEDDNEDRTMPQLAFDHLHHPSSFHAVLVVPDVSACLAESIDELLAERIVLMAKTNEDLDSRHLLSAISCHADAVAESLVSALYHSVRLPTIF